MKRLARGLPRGVDEGHVRVQRRVARPRRRLTQIVFTFLYIAGVYWMGGEIVSFGVILAMGILCEPLLAAHHQSGEYLQFLCEQHRLSGAHFRDHGRAGGGEAIVPDATEPPQRWTGEVTFEHVNFGYEEGSDRAERPEPARAGRGAHRAGGAHRARASPRWSTCCAGSTTCGADAITAALRRRNHAGHCAA